LIGFAAIPNLTVRFYYSILSNFGGIPFEKSFLEKAYFWLFWSVAFFRGLFGSRL
jgi:hypothetical protein